VAIKLPAESLSFLEKSRGPGELGNEPYWHRFCDIKRKLEVGKVKTIVGQSVVSRNGKVFICLGNLVNIKACARTECGLVREQNEDVVYVDSTYRFFIVCDGMGGHAAGEVAAELAASKAAETIVRLVGRVQAQGTLNIPSTWAKAILKQAFRDANNAVLDAAEIDERKRDMGSTMTILWLLEGFYAIGHVGDSRVYHSSAVDTKQLTRDHTLVNEMIKSGAIDAANAESSPYANALTQCIGMQRDVAVELRVEPLNVNDRFLVCSDGLSRYLDPSNLEILKNSDVECTTGELLSLAYSSGARDNVSAIVVHICDIEPQLMAVVTA
jgi:serine/threonine protein phosphatase PrpC